MRNKRAGWVGGLVLILLGVVFLVEQFFPGALGGWTFLLGLGLIFLVAYFLGQQYGFLIPGSILTSLGIGVALIENGVISAASEDGVMVTLLGLGFLAIWLVDLLVSRARPMGWWPIIPGGILTLVGIALLSENEAWLDSVGQWWPIVFIIVGVWILLERIIRRPS
jgi:hypothetical protein